MYYFITVHKMDLSVSGELRISLIDFMRIMKQEM